MDLKSYRLRQNWTLDELARFLGLGHASSAARYERGERLPRPEIVEKIEKLTAGQVTYHDLLAVRKQWSRRKDAQAA